MDLGLYLENIASEGTQHPEGKFTLDPSRGIGKLAQGSLASWHHSLLKILQVAERAGATELSVLFSREETRVNFAPDAPQALPSSTAVLKALNTPLRQVDPQAADLAGALLGAVSSNRRATWRELSLSSDLQLTLGESQDEKAGFSFVVEHDSGWKFWLTARRKAELLALFDQRCRFSTCVIHLDGWALEAADCALFNEDLREFHGSQFNPATGVMNTTKTRVAASLILFELAQSGKPALNIEPPSAEQFRQRGSLYAWTPALEQANELKPDGEGVNAWMLCFVSGLKNVPRPTEAHFRTVIAFNIHGPGNSEALHFIVVKQGVIVENRRLELEGEQWEIYRGCTIVMADDELETDLSGLKLVRNEKLVQRVAELRPLVEMGYRNFEALAPSVSFA